LEAVAKLVPAEPGEGRRGVVEIALRTPALLPGVPRDCLAAAVPGENEVDDRPLGLALAVEDEVAVPPRAPPLGGQSDGPTALHGGDALEGLVPLRGPFLLRLALGAGAPRTDADGPPSAVLLGVSQDSLELLVDLSTGPAGSLLGAMGEIHGRLRSRGFLHSHQLGEQQTDGLAALPVVLQQGGLVLAVPRGFPPVPPHQAHQARGLRVSPGCSQEPTQNLQSVRADREVN